MSNKKPKDTTPMSAHEKKKATIEQMMSKANSAREKNSNLIQRVRKDPALAKRVRERLCVDLRRVFEIPRNVLGPSASRRRYREHGHFSEELVTYLIGTWAEFKRQAKIEDSLGVRKVQNNIAKTLRAQQIMEYADENVKPWDGAYDTLDMTQDMVTLMIGSDWHSKFVDPFALRVWQEVMGEVMPDGIRYNGDLVDFPQLSRHRQLPGSFALTVQDEVNVAVDIMRTDRECCPDADIKFLLGNHDIRLITALADAAPVFCSLESLEYNQLFKLDELRVGLVARSTFLNPDGKMKRSDIAQNWETLNDAYGRPLYTIVHGFLCGKNSAGKHMSRFMTNGTNGHLHNPEVTMGGSLATGVLEWSQTGCMAHPAAVGEGYIPGPIEALGWASSFNIVRLFPKTRHVQHEQVKIGDTTAYWGGWVWTITQEERDARARMMEV